MLRSGAICLGLRAARMPATNDVDERAADAETFPQQFGRYLLTERIGAGGMAEIFRAVTVASEGFRRVLVVKRIRKSLDSSSAFLRMFFDEAKITALLNHPYIVQIYDFGQIDGAYFLAMEHVDGWDLGNVLRRLKEKGELVAPSTAALIAQQVAQGLHHAHTLQSTDGHPFNIVHRDVNPSNVMLVRTGMVKILDFGIAKASVAAGKAQTQASVIKGKLGYLSPEQARCLRLDGRSDVFSLGTTLWEMLTGERLFVGVSDFERIANVLEAPIVPPSRHRPGIPPALDAIVMKALERDRNRRYPSAEAIAEDLDEFLRGQPSESQAIKKLLRRLYDLDGVGNTASLPAIEAPTAVTVAKTESNPPEQALPASTPPERSASLTSVPTRRRAGPLLWGIAASLLVASAAVVLFVFRSAPAAHAAGARASEDPAGPVRIELTSEPPGATVSGRRGPLGATPLVLTLPASAGVQQLWFEKSGFAREPYELRPKSGGLVFVELHHLAGAEARSAKDRL